MSIGYIKLHRAFEDWYGISDPSRVSLWVHILLMANHKEKKWIFKGEPFRAERGQFITSRKSLSIRTGIKEWKVEKILKEFESQQQITQQSTNVNRLITIINYDSYQGFQQQSQQQVNNKPTTDQQQTNTNKNDKNDKNDKKGIKYSENFLKIWEKYPNKDGKREANRHFLATVKCSEDFENIKIALNKYLKTKPVKDNFIKKGSTWFNQWEDYIEWVEPEANMKSEQDKLAERLGV